MTIAPGIPKETMSVRPEYLVHTVNYSTYAWLRDKSQEVSWAQPSSSFPSHGQAKEDGPSPCPAALQCRLHV